MSGWQPVASDIWEARVSGSGAVLHGSATLFTAWAQAPDLRWHNCGSYWSRAEAEAAIPPAPDALRKPTQEAAA